MYEKWLNTMAHVQYWMMLIDLFLFMWSYKLPEKKVYFTNWRKSKVKALKLWRAVWQDLSTNDDYFANIRALPEATKMAYTIIFQDRWTLLPEGMIE